MWFTGIDWADTHHDIVVLAETGDECLQLRIDHTPAGVNELIIRLRELTGPDHLHEMVCVIETKTNLLVTALLEAGFALYPVNPKTTDRWRPASGAKSDVADARILARVARSDWQHLTRLERPDEAIQHLQILVRDQEGLIEHQTRLCNQLKACLKAYYPAVLQGLTTDMTQKSVLAFVLAYPTPDQARQASHEQLVTLFQACHNPHARESAQRLWNQLQQPALVATPAMVQAKAQLAQALVSMLQQVMQSLKTYDTQIT